MLGKIEGKRRSGRQNEMVGWHHRLDGHEFEQALGVGDGQARWSSEGPQGPPLWRGAKSRSFFVVKDALSLCVGVTSAPPGRVL